MGFVMPSSFPAYSGSPITLPIRHTVRMTQRHLIQNQIPMLITMVVRDRAPVFRHAPLASEAVGCLYRVQELHPFFLYGFVIMPDHVHLLLKVPKPQRVADVVSALKSGLLFDAGRSSFWQPRYHMRFIDDLPSALRYIHLNPVRADIADEPEHYPWSSASGLWDVTPVQSDSGVLVHA